MEYNRFLTDKYNSNDKDLDFSIKSTYRRLSALFLNFSRLQILGDDTSCTSFKEILDTPEVFMPNKSNDFLKQKALCIQFINYISKHQNDEIFNNHALMDHPYIKAVVDTACINATDLWVSSANESERPVFDVVNYIKLICKVDEKTNKIIDFSDEIKHGYHNKESLNKLNSALDSIQDTYNMYKKEQEQQYTKVK